ncbi:hypothetical protein F0L74_15160 [Chitinophaga agrisoli]|uniref:Uncharacterized protein n=1 Tax=Chitinophaga agrisoli TaxID=2607653 RepID=A0A5B2VZQ2_9BACT|nr:hypothetical protein [Chitinophaga agrisoli]KAA2243812.1 hypothetical protein F0L74_15160 [Chitinophaga agrisoli]
MAKQTGVIKFTGKLGNLIGYRRNGKHCLRTMPETVRQTVATRQAAARFGVASRKGKLIRRAIVPRLDIRCNGTLVNRLNRALILTCKNNMQTLEGFRFNPHTGLDKLIPQLPVYTSAGILHLPAQELPKPGTATHLEFCAIAVRINFTERRVVHVEEATTLIDLRTPFTGLDLPISAPGKGALLLVLQVRACTAHNGIIQASGDRRQVAADIITVITPAAVQKWEGKVKTRKQHTPVYKPGNSMTGYKHTLKQALPASITGATPAPVFKLQLE